MMTMVKIILASSSPRRAEILRKLGIKFEVREPIYEPKLLEGTPEEMVKFAALEKARQVAGFYTEGIVIAADTIVVVDGEILGKPRNKEEAKKFLRKLSGKVHKVYTGIAVIDVASGKEVVDVSISEVKFKELSEEEIEFYVKTGEPLDKAGAYAIQGIGAIFVEWIKGDFYGIVGLPINKLYNFLQKLGLI